MSTLIDARLLKFGVVGASGMLADFSVTWLCKEKWKLNKYIANSLGFSFAVINNFLLNRYWTFNYSHQPFTAQFAKFTLVAVSGLIINNILLHLLLQFSRKDFYLLKLSVTGLVFFWNYFINFLFTFN